MGLSEPMVTVGNITGPLLAGAMADKLGDYRLAFTVLASITALGSMLILTAGKPTYPDPTPHHVGT